MSFKKLLSLISFFIILSSCGVKGNPRPPKKTNLPSIIDEYKINNTEEHKDDSENSKKKSE